MVLRSLPSLLLLLAGCGCGATGHAGSAPESAAAETPSENGSAEGERTPALQLSPDQWRERLSPEEYRVLRDHGTERAFTGDLLRNHEPGTYVCAGCEAPLFSSETKFESGTGWPSFTSPLRAGQVGETRDQTFGMVRTEVHCARCGGHLGHVFPDGPEPTGLRYCINSVSLDFEPQASDEANPANPANPADPADPASP